MIENILIVDTETTALEVEQGQVIEVGAILYSVKHQTPIQQISTLLPATQNPAVNINHISLEILLDISVETAEAGIKTIARMAKMADFIVAHNAEFDKKWFGRKNGEIILPKLLNSQGEELRWICTCDDFEFPKQTRPRSSLVDLVLAHGIGVYANHRALTDCQLIAALFDVMEDLQGLFIQATRPKARCIALVSYQERDLAKQAGFKWFPETKTWERIIAAEDINSLPFPVLCKNI
ncbi:MAG: 3'-5' exonuclease [Methylacidiphilales bacterium]|nr:3'-5' exonuclease [Candidatus Methylacidiphilales bacterium]NJR19655.1 3'-5' exonuclease [Calothrix sp. CSU_2_0]